LRSSLRSFNIFDFFGLKFRWITDSEVAFCFDNGFFVSYHAWCLCDGQWINTTLFIFLCKLSSGRHILIFPIFLVFRVLKDNCIEESCSRRDTFIRNWRHPNWFGYLQIHLWECQIGLIFVSFEKCLVLYQ
jgi:hypothetical protein